MHKAMCVFIDEQNFSKKMQKTRVKSSFYPLFEYVSEIKIVLMKRESEIANCCKISH